MGEKNNGLKNFADLAAMLNRMREEEPPAPTPRPKSPKSKRSEVATTWQPLAEMPHPLPEQLQVHLRLGQHPKTGAPQWFGFYTHGQQRLKVVCDPYLGHELPTGGEVWTVTVKKDIPGIVFATAEGSEALLAQQAAERQKSAADQERWLTATGAYITVSVSLPHNPQFDWEGAEGAITGYEYHGRLAGVSEHDGVWTLELSDVFRSTHGHEFGQYFASDSRYHSDRFKVVVCGVTVSDNVLLGWQSRQYGDASVTAYLD